MWRGVVLLLISLSSSLVVSAAGASLHARRLASGSAGFDIAAQEKPAANRGSEAKLPRVILSGVPFKLELLPGASYSGRDWPDHVLVTVKASAPLADQSCVSPPPAVTVFSANVTGFASSFSIARGDLPPIALKVTAEASGKLRLGSHSWTVTVGEETPFVVDSKDGGFVIPGFLAILPPILTLILAIAARQVLAALLLGIWAAATLANRYNAAVGLLRTVDQYFVGGFTGGGHAAVILFTFFLGGLIGGVQRSGGAVGLASVATKFTTSPVRGQLAVWVLGLLIFFDDYSSILIVGNALRTIVGSVGISPQKFAYLIHTMGCALASFAPVSSWVGVQLGYIQGSYASIGQDVNAFILFLQTIPFRIYPLLVIFFCLMLIMTQRDFGPMLHAEREFRRRQGLNSDGTRKLAYDDGGKSSFLSNSDSGDRAEGSRGAVRGVFSSDDDDGPPQHVRTGLSDSDVSAYSLQVNDRHDTASTVSAADASTPAPNGPLDPIPGKPQRWVNAAVPFTVVIITTFVGMYVDGLLTCEQIGVPSTIVNIFSNANSLDALLWASGAGCLVLGLMVVPQKILTFSEVMESWINGIKDVLEPTIVLILAWALGAALQDIQTAQFLVQVIGKSLPVWTLPAIVSILSSIMSFATGTAFGTWGILFPLVVPLAWDLSNGDADVMLLCISAMFGGVIFGNNASPIADNTVLSSAASGCKMDEHVNTTLPYSTVLCLLSILIYIPMGIWPSWFKGWLGLLACLVTAAALLYFVGQRVDSVPSAVDQTSKMARLRNRMQGVVSPRSRMRSKYEPIQTNM